MATQLVLLVMGAMAPFLTPADATPRQFEIPSADGISVHGEVDLPTKPASVVVLMVAGTGNFDRDARFGKSGTPRDKLFKDLAARITSRGGMVVRYDKRGYTFQSGGAPQPDHDLLGKTTTTAMLQDLRAVYDWTRSPNGLGARCLVILAHSEGMIHTGRLAASGAPAPALVIGMGGVMQSPVAALRWQLTQRDVFSLKMMDADHDWVTTNDEVEANWRRTPSGALDNLGILLNPDGKWTGADLAMLSRRDETLYEEIRRSALTQLDTSPYPNAAAASASYQWWKSWFLDDTPVAKNLSLWSTRVILHYGSWDSQTNPSVEVPMAKAFLPQDKLTIETHPGGHSLGRHPLYGPIDEAVADEIAEEAVAACGG